MANLFIYLFTDFHSICFVSFFPNGFAERLVSQENALERSKVSSAPVLVAKNKTKTKTKTKSKLKKQNKQTNKQKQQTKKTPPT